MNRLQIFKIQLPLASNEGVERAFIYNRDRSVSVLLPVDETIRIVTNGEPKSFVYGYIDGKNIMLKDAAPWQDW